MADLTLAAFAYLRTPLALAAAAFMAGAIGAWRLRGERAYLALALMMVGFFQAARLALVVFDPYLSSRPLAEALLHAPKGKLILDREYYAFSSIVFYANQNALLLNGRRNNLEYGSYAPGAPEVFITDAGLPGLWARPERYYMAAEDPQKARLEKLLGRSNLHAVAESGGKTLFTNEAIPPARVPHAHRD